ncbi:MAG: PorT family protein [Chlamydiia bacterium]|nr:PorT family protein [Chlamydiia bacterium]
MSKRILLLLILPIVFISSAYAQKEVENIPNFDEQKWHWGYYFGANMYDFKLSPNAKGMTEDGALGIETSVFPGFTVGLIGDIRLNDYFNLRFEPGLDMVDRELTYHKDVMSRYDGSIYDRSDNLRRIKSTYINLPLLLKFGGKRRHNIRPYLIGGMNVSIDLSSNEKSSNDNTNGEHGFRMTTLNYSWQAGAGIDWYLPHFKFTTEIRGSFGINNELIKDNEVTPWTDPIDNLQSRAVFFVIKFE